MKIKEITTTVQDYTVTYTFDDSLTEITIQDTKNHKILFMGDIEELMEMEKLFEVVKNIDIKKEMRSI